MLRRLIGYLELYAHNDNANMMIYTNFALLVSCVIRKHLLISIEVQLRLMKMSLD